MTMVFSDEEQEILLARPIRRLLGSEERERFAGARALVTGAGGSIGSELARQLASCRPARLTLIDQSEHNLFQVERQLREEWPRVPLDPVLADVTRAASMRRILRRSRPQVVFHAAAYKHVTMAERAVCAAAAVNVLGTAAALAAASEVGARFMLISSDKAAAPTSVMGATKRLAELVTIGATPSVRASVVRFGNVLGSSGSVVPLMAERIAEGRPIVVTDPAATRYFMTVREAVSLVMKADGLAGGGETFWFDMGQPVVLADLVERLLRVCAAHGLPPVPTEIVGLRPGEKLAEELTTHGLVMTRSSDPDIWMADQHPASPELPRGAMGAMVRAIARGDALGTLRALAAAVPGFEPSAHAWASARSEQLYVRRDRRRSVKIA